jgi:7-cyano-7-deazaguanine synthase
MIKNINKKAIVLISGGMDSALCAGIAISLGYEVCALHINYGQRTINREKKAFNDICDFYKIKNVLCSDIKYLADIGGSSLTDKSMKISKANLESSEIPTSYVPFRNANILSIAVSWAEVLDAGAIFIGAMEEDSSGYPDCREDFFKSFETMIDLGTKPETKIKIIPPLIHLTKKEVVEKSIKLNVPLHLTWSCYQNEDKACGVCDSCALRLRGFEMAGENDPIEYE